MRRTICKIVLQLDGCSAMQAENKGCKLLLRALIEIVSDGTLDSGSVEKALKGAGENNKKDGEDFFDQREPNF